MSESYELSGASPGKYTNNADMGESGLVNKGFEAEEGNGQVPASENIHVPDHHDIHLNSKNQHNRGNSNKYNDDGDDDDDNDNRNDDSWEDLDDDDNPNACSIFVGKFQNWLSEFVTRHGTLLRTAFLIVLLLGYYAYFGYAMYYEFGSEGSLRLLVCTVVAVLILSSHLCTKYRKSRSPVKEDVEDDGEGKWVRSWNRFAEKTRFATSIQILLIIGFIVLICADIAPNNPRNLMSLTGMAFFIISCYIFSYNPSKVKWRPVILGLAIQVIFALLILRTTAGYEAFKWLGNRVKEFLDYTDEGSKFVFGDTFQNHFFAFKVLPVVIFFSTVVSMLYYLGVMQVLIRLIGKFLALCLGTSPTESINAAANIFIGQTEAPLLIRPFLHDMTNSEIHAVMTGGFATIAGSVMAAYILYGVPANHLLSASVMSAPAALAFSKLFYPETKKTRIQAKDVYNLSKGSERNIIEAASNGASMAISLVANIAVNLIAFIALITFVNSTLIWFGDRVGYGELTFQNVCSYVFWPLSFLMGVEQDDCRKVAELIGTKTFLNEFVAYVALSEYIHNKENLTKYLDLAKDNLTQNLTGIWYEEDGDIFLQDSGEILKNGLMSDRSVVITTYALCGFSNLASMGIQLGALGAMAPSRKGDMSRLVVRAMLTGNVACFMTACISGLLYDGK